MLKILKKYYPELFLFGVVALLFAKNYVPGTYLIGWDSLQTEFYPWLAVKRAFLSVWEEYQSFGLPTGMAHAADLIRALFVFLLSFVVERSLVRYIFHHLMLLIGGMGAYNLFKHFGFNSKKSVFALLGAVFYILNLGTSQMFGVPFEPFSVFFASLPWEILSLLNYIEDKDNLKKKLFLLVLVNILATPQAYQQSIFLVYMLVICLIVLGVVVKEVINGRKEIACNYMKKFLSAVLIIFVINSFWIFPQVYTLRSSANLTKQAKINQLATDTVINRNVEKGRIQYLARFENFYYDLKDTNGNFLFSSWRNHFSNRLTFILSYIPFAFVVIGLIFGKKKYNYSVIGMFLFTSLIFLSGTPPLSTIGECLREISILGQIFRSPFTKFIFPHVLISSYLFAFGLEFLYSKTLGLLLKNRFLTTLYVASAFVLVFHISYPAFEGGMFLPQMKLRVPDQYIQLMEYFRNEDKNTRIALLPDYTFWGWFQHNWGYDGSGFLWYGVEQPIISRTFDVWSKESESYFWEIKRSIESQDFEGFKKILDKYDIDYLVIDYSLNPVTSVESGLQYDQISEIIRNSPDIHIVKSFQNIDVFKRPNETDKFFLTSSSLPNVGLGYELTDQDSAYNDIGTYITSLSSGYDFVYPFIDLMTKTDRFDRQWEIYEGDDSFTVSASVKGLNLSNYFIAGDNASLEAEIFDGENITHYNLTGDIFVQDEKANVIVKKVLVEDIPVEEAPLVNCRNNLADYGKNITTKGTLQLYSKDKAAACFSYTTPFLAHWNSYLIKVESKNISGEPLFFYIVGSKSNAQSKMEENLPSGNKYFILGSGNYFDDGYTFGFQNISYSKETSINELNSLKVYLFPFDYLKSVKFVNKNAKFTFSQPSKLEGSKKLSYFLYYLNQGDPSNNTLIFYQAFNEGWLALCGFKVCSADHVRINNWANGWVFKEAIPDSVLILYWPQLLQFLGFFLLIVLLVFVIFCDDRKETGDKNIVKATKKESITWPHSVDKH